MSNQAATHPPGELRKWAEVAREHGWTVTRRRRHWRWTPPSGPIIFTESTKAGGRAERNTRARLRAAGLPV